MHHHYELLSVNFNIHHFGKKLHIILFFLSRFATQLIGSPVRFFVFFIQKYPGAFFPAIRLLVFLH